MKAEVVRGRMNERSRYLTVEQAAEYLSCSKWTVYKLVDRRKIPFIPITVEDNGSKSIVRFDRQALDVWMAEKMVRPLTRNGQPKD